MILRRLLIVSLLFCPLMASAYNFVVGQRVTPVTISNLGELVLSHNGEVSYKSWMSSQLEGKVRIVQYIAGRKSAKKKIHC